MNCKYRINRYEYNIKSHSYKKELFSFVRKCIHYRVQNKRIACYGLKF